MPVWALMDTSWAKHKRWGPGRSPAPRPRLPSTPCWRARHGRARLDRPTAWANDWLQAARPRHELPEWQSRSAEWLHGAPRHGLRGNGRAHTSGRDNMHLVRPCKSVIRTRPMRILALFLALLLAGCSKPSWHMTDITGGMPRLAFHMSQNGRPVTGAGFSGQDGGALFRLHQLPGCLPRHAWPIWPTCWPRCISPIVRILFVTRGPRPRHADAVLADYAAAFSPQIDGLARHANDWPTWRGAIASPIP